MSKHLLDFKDIEKKDIEKLIDITGKLNPEKTDKILRNLGLNPDDFATYLNQLTQSGTSPDANAIQSEQPQNEQQRTVPNEFDNEGEAVDIDDLFSISVEGVI